MTWNNVFTNLFDDPDLPLLLVHPPVRLKGHDVGPLQRLIRSPGHLEGLQAFLALGLLGLGAFGGHSLTAGRPVAGPEAGKRRLSTPAVSGHLVSRDAPQS